MKRWNLLIGIPDTIFFLASDDVIHVIVDVLFWVPSSAILGKVCPPNFEACTYAYLAGVSNFSKMVSTIGGAWLTELFNITTIEGATHCNWTNLEYLILGGHVILVLVVSIPASLLIPNEEQGADLLKKKLVVVTEHVELMEDEFGTTSDILL